MSNLIGNIGFWMFVFGLIMTYKALPRMIFYWERHFSADRITIKRLANEQKICDKVIAYYYTITTLTGLWLVASGISHYFSILNPIIIKMALPCSLIVLYVFYLIISDRLLDKHNIKQTKDKLIKYRKSLETVTKENDYEVMFIRASNKIGYQPTLVLLWIIIIVLTVIVL
jgi:uncharacterized membrane protein